MSDKSLPMHMVQATPSLTPPSFNGDTSLFTFNLFVMTAMLFLGMAFAGRHGLRIWQHRHHDHPLHPVTLVRLVWFFAGVAVMLRCGAEAMLLYGWSPQDADLTARVIMAKRWIDPFSVGCGALWMTISTLGEPGIEYQLRNKPIPIDPWSRWPMLVRAGGIVGLSLIMAVAAVTLR